VSAETTASPASLAGSLTRTLALALLLLGLGFVGRSALEGGALVRLLGLGDPPATMRTVAICHGGAMPAGQRLQRPTALAVAGDEVYVADAGRRVLERWDVPACRPLASTSLTALNAGGVIALAWRTDGALVALEDGAARATVLDAELRPTDRISLEGERPRQPRGLALDAEGAMSIADGSGTVATYAPDGRPIGRFGGAGSEPGRLRDPTALAPHRGGLLVADTGNGRVQLFSRDGAPLAQWTPPAPISQLAATADGRAIGASPRAGQLVALGPGAGGFVLVHGPDGAPLRVGGDVLAAGAGGRIAGASVEGIILLELQPEP
jgi:hypothetical protein